MGKGNLYHVTHAILEGRTRKAQSRTSENEIAKEINMADERFSGDMSRNEVEMDLSKFMEMIQENAALKDEIRDLKANDTINPWQKWIHLAKAVDSLSLIHI